MGVFESVVDLVELNCDRVSSCEVGGLSEVRGCCRWYSVDDVRGSGSGISESLSGSKRASSAVELDIDCMSSVACDQVSPSSSAMGGGVFDTGSDSQRLHELLSSVLAGKSDIVVRIFLALECH